MPRACDRPYLIETKRGSFEADVVLANLTPWALVKLMGDEAPVGFAAAREKLEADLRRVHGVSRRG